MQSESDYPPPAGLRKTIVDEAARAARGDAPDGAPSGGEAAPLLDNRGDNAPVIVGGLPVLGDDARRAEKRAYIPWTRRQCRTHRRLRLVLAAWLKLNYSVLFVTLSGTPHSSRRQLSRHYNSLLQRIKRAYQVRPWYFKCITTEGPQGVIHALWAFPRLSAKVLPLFIPWQWLSSCWLEIHGAWNVAIKRVGSTSTDVRKLSRYVINQYLSRGQGSQYVRGDWSRALGLLSDKVRL